MGWGEFFALAAPVTWALAVIMFRRAGETMPPFELNLCKNTISMVLMAATLIGWLLIMELPWPEFSGGEWVLMLISGVLGMALADTFYLRTLNLVGAGRTGVVGSLLSPFVIFISAWYLGERLAPLQWLGFLLVMAGILVVTLKRYRTEVSASALRRGMLLGVVAMLSLAAGVVMVKPLLETGPFLFVATVRLAGGVLAMLALVTVRRGWGRMLDTYRAPHPWRMVIFASVLGGFIGSLFWLAGYKLIPASEASIYNESQLIFMVLFAWWFLGESINGRKVLGVVLTLLGVLLMLLANVQVH